MKPTLEDALKKLDSIEQNLNYQAEEIAQKDNRLFQFSKLIKGQENIFQKQYQNIFELKEKLQKEIEDKNISQEQVEHLREDINRLDQEKQELDKQVKELEDAEGEIKKARDKEIQELKARIINLNDQLETVIKSDKTVFDILGQHSDKSNLVLRSQEVIEKLENTEKELYKANWLERIVEDKAWEDSPPKSDGETSDYAIQLLSKKAETFGKEIQKITFSNAFYFKIFFYKKMQKNQEDKGYFEFGNINPIGGAVQIPLINNFRQVIKMLKEKAI